MIKPVSKSWLTTCFAFTIFFSTAIWFVGSRKDWRFYDDDYGAVHVGQTSDLKEILGYFSYNHNERSVMPSNMRDQMDESAYRVTFRPLTLLWYNLVVRVLDPMQQQHYFIFSILLHALAAVLLFFLFLSFFGPGKAFLAAMLFAFFPVLGTFIGRFVFQVYTLCVIFFSLALLCLNKFLKQESVLWLMPASLAFGAALLLHEVSLGYFIVFPAFAALFYYNRGWLSKNYWPITMMDLILVAMPFFIILSAYLMARFSVYSAEGTSLIGEIFYRLPYRFYNFVSLIVDTLGMSWLGAGTKAYKLVGIAIYTAFFWAVYHFSYQKNLLRWLAIICLTQLWSSFIICHQARYLYFALPTLIFAVFLALETLLPSSIETGLKRFGQAAYFFVFATGMYAIDRDLDSLEQKFVFCDQAIRSFVYDNFELQDKALCFAGLPFDHFHVSGLAQAIWLYRNNDKAPIYYDSLHALRFERPNSLPGVEQVKITKQEDGFKMEVTPDSAAHVLLKDPFELSYPYSMGEVDLTFAHENKAYELEYKLNQEWRLQGLALITWDFEQRKFVCA